MAWLGLGLQLCDGLVRARLKVTLTLTKCALRRGSCHVCVTAMRIGQARARLLGPPAKVCPSRLICICIVNTYICRYRRACRYRLTYLYLYLAACRKRLPAEGRRTASSSSTRKERSPAVRAALYTP